MSARRRAPLRRVFWPLALATLWLLFAYLVAPLLITALYQGDVVVSHPDLARELAEERAAAPLEVHLGEWRWFALWPVVATSIWCLFVVGFADPRRCRDHVLGATPTSLAGLRIVVCGTALFVVSREHLPSLALLPPAMGEGMGNFELARIVPGFERLLASGPALAVLQLGTAALLLLALLGWRTRWTLPAAAVAYLFVGGALRVYGRFFHAGLTPFYLLAVLAFAPVGDAISLDRRRRSRRGEPVPDAEAPRAVDGACRFAVWTVMALIYLESGLSKLRDGGVMWWHPDNLRHIVYRDSLAPMAYDFDLGLAAAVAPDVVFAAAGLTALSIELAYPAVLFSVRARRILPAAVAVFHVGILFVQNVAFFDLILLQAVFYDWRRLLPARLAARSPPHPARDQEGVGTWPDCELRRHPLRWPWRLAAVFLVAWGVRLELYPFSAMQMYAERSTTGAVEYLQVHAERRTGRREPAPLETAIPALADSRYRSVLDQLFEGDPQEARVAADYLLAAGRAYNRRVTSEGEEIVAFEVEKYRWDYRAVPEQATRSAPGERLASRRVEIVVEER